MGNQEEKGAAKEEKIAQQQFSFDEDQQFYLFSHHLLGQGSWLKIILKIQLNEKQKTNQISPIPECLSKKQMSPSAALPILGKGKATERNQSQCQYNKVPEASSNYYISYMSEIWRGIQTVFGDYGINILTTGAVVY